MSAATPPKVPGTDARFGPPAVPPGHRLAGGPTTWLWASVGAVDEPPDRVQVFDCHHCGALVSWAGRGRHTAWHQGDRS